MAAMYFSSPVTIWAILVLWAASAASSNTSKFSFAPLIPPLSLTSLQSAVTPVLNALPYWALSPVKGAISAMVYSPAASCSVSLEVPSCFSVAAAGCSAGASAFWEHAPSVIANNTIPKPIHFFICFPSAILV